MRARRETELAEFRDGVITALVVRRGQSDRVGVHLNGRLVFDLAALLVDRAGLRAGDPLDADSQKRLRQEDAPYRARERALRALGVRDRSRREMERRLRQAGFEAAVTEEALAWLSGLGYLDDRRFASAYATEKRRGGWGDARIKAELMGKGIERAVIDEVLREQADSLDDGQAAEFLEQTVRRRFSTQFATDPDAAERRLTGFLARRGYDWETIGRLARLMRAEAAAAGAETARGDAEISPTGGEV